MEGENEITNITLAINVNGDNNNGKRCINYGLTFEANWKPNSLFPEQSLPS